MWSTRSRHAPYLDIPDDVVDYLHYLDFVKLRSPRTVNGYYLGPARLLPLYDAALAIARPTPRRPRKST